MYQTGRQYELIIGDPKTTKALVVESPMQVKFHIEKHIYNNRKLNTAVFEILNLSKDTRKFFEGIEYPQVIFSCGYSGVGAMGLIFSGQAVSVSSEKTSEGIVTKLSCAESFVQLHNVLVASTVPKGKTIAQVVDILVDKMQNTAIGKISGKALLKTIASGFPMEGTPRQILNELGDAYQLQWRIDRNTLYVRDDGGSYYNPSEEVVLLTGATGLVGIPAYKNKKAGKAEKDASGLPGIEFKALLNPALTAGSFVKIESEVADMNGVYQIRDITFEGGFRSNEWYIEAECDEIKKD